MNLLGGNPRFFQGGEEVRSSNSTTKTLVTSPQLQSTSIKLNNTPLEIDTFIVILLVVAGLIIIRFVKKQ
jgi:hypothetical protein